MKSSLDREAQLAIVSDNLKRLREKMYPGHGGKKQVADAMRLKIQQWSPWEKGQRIPSDIRLEKIAAFFSVSVDYIWTDHRTAFAENAIVSPQNQKADPENVINETPDLSGNAVLSSSNLKDESPVSQNNKEQIANVIKEQIKSVIQMNDVMAILKLKFSVVDVEIVTSP